MKPLAVLAIAAVTGTAVLVSGSSHGTAGAPKKTSRPPETQVGSPPPDPPGTINGAEHPELIPDHAAYAAIFRMVSNRRTAAEIHSIRAYVRQVMGLGTQRKCQGCRPSVGDGDADIDAFLATAEEFHRRVSVIDAQAAEIKESTWPNPSPDVMAQLRRLQQQKENLAVELMASLPRRLSPDGAQRVRRHINDYVKRGVKLIPEPATPPGGPGWESGPPANVAGHHHS